jgi:hypothetical protein
MEENKCPDNYPETFLEKAGYAEYCLIKSLESLSPALLRVSRLQSLLRVCEKDGGNTLPGIITHNEARMALEKLLLLKSDIDEAFAELGAIYKTTKGAMKDVPKSDELA